MNPNFETLIGKSKKRANIDLSLAVALFLIAIASFVLFIVFYVYGYTLLFEGLSFLSLLLFGFPAIYFLIGFIEAKKEVAALKGLAQGPFVMVSGKVASLQPFTLSKGKETIEIALTGGKIIYWWTRLGPCPFVESHEYSFTLKDNLIIKGEEK